MDITPLKHGALGKKIAEGSHAIIYEIIAASCTPANLIVKIGKTDEYSPPFLHGLRIKLSRKKVSSFLGKAFGPEFRINPDTGFIRRGFAQYCLIKTYFGFLKEHSTIRGHKKIENIRTKILTDLNDPASLFYQELSRILGNGILYEEVARIFGKRANANFLPKEQVVIGHPPNFLHKDIAILDTQLKELPVTYYLFQEYVRGKPLYQFNQQKLARYPTLVENLLVFALLAKRMYHDTGMIIDTRPEEIAKHPLEWFQKTGNIMVNTNTQAVFFVDTRWLWNNQSRLIGRRGFNLVEHLGLRSVNRAIATYAHMLTS